MCNGKSIAEVVVTFNFSKGRHVHNFSWSSRHGKMESILNLNNMILKIAITSKLQRSKSERVSARKTKLLQNYKFGKTYFSQKVILKNNYL